MKLQGQGLDYQVLKVKGKILYASENLTTCTISNISTNFVVNTSENIYKNWSKYKL